MLTNSCTCPIYNPCTCANDPITIPASRADDLPIKIRQQCKVDGGQVIPRPTAPLDLLAPYIDPPPKRPCADPDCDRPGRYEGRCARHEKPVVAGWGTRALSRIRGG